MNALDTIRRWRHTHGYGVHSPLAYRIVKDCIRPDSKYGFYSDAYLDFEYHEDRKGLKNSRMIIRLVNLLRPSRIWYPNGDKRLCTALKMSFPKLHVATQKDCPKNVDFIIVSDKKNYFDIWNKMEGHIDCGMIVFGSDIDIDKLEGVTLTLSGKHFTISLRRQGMDFINYCI